MSPEVRSAAAILPPDGVVGDGVGILMSDIVGSTRLAQALDEQWERVLFQHHDRVRTSCLRHHGFEAGNQGDGFLFLFPDVAAALHAATDMLRAVEADGIGVGLRIRIGLHSGVVGFRASSGFVGIDLHRTARVLSTADGSQIILSQAARDELVRSGALAPDRAVDRGRYKLKDLVRPEHLFELDGSPSSGRLRAASVVGDAFGPTPCELVGRDELLATVERSLSDAAGALVTLHGLGGVGKTRLAIEVVRRASGREAVLVNISAVSQASDVVPQIARALGAQAETTVEELALMLDGRAPLVVIDNIEHVIDASADVARLARLALDARFLVTSRRPLRVANEIAIPVEPLSLDSSSGRPSALLLFETLAAAFGHPTPFTSAEADDAAAICRLLDGLPLAMELAATRLRVLGSRHLREQLTSSQQALGAGRRDSPPRHLTLDALITSTRSLLSAGSRDALDCLSALPAGGTVEQVAEFTGLDESAAFDAVSELVDYRLVHGRDAATGQRLFALLRVVREAIWTDVERRGRAGRYRLEVGGYYRQLARGSREAVESADRRQDLFLHFAEELETIRAVLGWAEHDTALLNVGNAVLAGMTTFWWSEHLAEGISWMKRLAEAAGRARHPSEPRLLVRAALLSSYGGASEEAIRLAGRGIAASRRVEAAAPDLSLGLQVLAAARSARGERALALAAVREGLEIDAGLPEGIRAVHLVNHANVLLAEDLVEEAEPLYAESLEFFRRVGDGWLIAGPLSRTGDLALRRGDVDRAVALLEEAAASWSTNSGTTGRARTQGGLARALLLAGDHEGARAVAIEALDWAVACGTLGEAHWSIAVLAAVEMERGHAETAASAFRAALRIARAYAQPIHGCLSHDLAPWWDPVAAPLPTGGPSTELTGPPVEQLLTELNARWSIRS